MKCGEVEGSLDGRFQLIAHQRPDFLHRILSGDLPPKFGIEIFRVRARGLAGDGKTVA